MLDIVPSCNPEQYQEKTNDVNLVKWPNFGPSNFFSGVLPLIVARNCSKLSYMQFKEKLMNQTWKKKKKSEKPNFGPNFDPFGPNLGIQIFFREFYRYYILEIVSSNHRMQFQWKIRIQTQEMMKSLILSLILVRWTQIRTVKYFFSQISLSQLLDIMVRYQNVKYQKKLMIQLWANLVTDGRTDRQTDECDFIGCRPTNVEHPSTYL